MRWFPILLALTLWLGADTVTSTPAVQQGFRDAWCGSYPHFSDEGYGEDHAALTHERGGWIVRDTRSGETQCFPTAPGRPRDPEDPSSPITLPEREYFEDDRGVKYADADGRYQILAGYHTHPTNDSPHGDASEHDKQGCIQRRLPEYIIDETGVHKFDPKKDDNPRTDKDERTSSEEGEKQTTARNDAARKAQKAKREELRRQR